jgi:hypothetical protein
LSLLEERVEKKIVENRNMQRDIEEELRKCDSTSAHLRDIEKQER